MARRMQTLQTTELDISQSNEHATKDDLFKSQEHKGPFWILREDATYLTLDRDGVVNCKVNQSAFTPSKVQECSHHFTIQHWHVFLFYWTAWERAKKVHLEMFNTAITDHAWRIETDAPPNLRNRRAAGASRQLSRAAPQHSAASADLTQTQPPGSTVVTEERTQKQYLNNCKKSSQESSIPPCLPTLQST